MVFLLLMKKCVLPVFFLLIASGSAWAQPSYRQCVTTELHSRSAHRSHYAGGKAFEEWLTQAEAAESEKSIQDNDDLYYIPVVFHILHNGEAVGNGRNIGDNRVLEQIDILNQDYAKAFGTPGFNTHPSGADSRIRFCRAAVDPNGQPTSGIIRVNTTQAEFSINSDNAAIKGYSVWNTEKYLNVWVCKLSNNDLGYAQLPYTDSLQFNGIADVQPDGVVIDYRAFGNVPAGQGYSAYNMGRTATHEIGHFLGLIHIWGDGFGCNDNNATDYCNDTPKQANWTSGCPTNVPASCDGSTPNQQQNYLDYTNDACMNLFTNDQKRRMRVVMRNAPRRKTLFTTPTQCGVTANSNFISKAGWAFYPNPAADELVVSPEEDGSIQRIEVLDMQGKRCLHQLCNGTEITPISVAGLQKGVYTLSVTENSGKISFRKFVKN